MTPAGENTLLTAALGYAALGWRVFPLRPGEKRPAFPDHTEDKCTGRDPRCRDGHSGWEPRATTDPARIARCWAAGAYNIGVACGPSRLVVVDLDTPGPGESPPAPWDLPGVNDGSDVFAVLAGQAGQPVPFGTHLVKTGGGGLHLYFAAPAAPELRNTAGRLGWKIDTRAAGGYVVAAGSVVAGRPYQTLTECTPAHLPDWLTDLLAPAPDPDPAAPPVPVHPVRRSAYLSAALAGEARRVRQAPAGQRNNALYIASVALGQLVAGGALPEPHAWQFLTELAGPHVSTAAFTPGQRDATITSGLRAGARRPRQVAA
ncbi:MAG TPA: bifunctional DNA primase/polymerase [Mycobacteriales bacterium]|nr:bifunctional DNA primase/polymerase [Mycobacteriales bacterium]